MKHFRNILWLAPGAFDIVKTRFHKHLTSNEKGKEVPYELRPDLEGIATARFAEIKIKPE